MTTKNLIVIGLYGDRGVIHLCITIIGQPDTGFHQLIILVEDLGDGGDTALDIGNLRI